MVAIHAVRQWMNSELTVTADTFFWLFILAVLANVAYCAAYLADIPGAALRIQVRMVEGEMVYGLAVLLIGLGICGHPGSLFFPGNLLA